MGNDNRLYLLLTQYSKLEIINAILTFDKLMPAIIRLTLAASPYCPLVNSMLNFLTNRSSAPARLFLTARRRANSGFCSTVLMYGTIESSSTVTDST